MRRTQVGLLWIRFIDVWEVVGAELMQQALDTESAENDVVSEVHVRVSRRTRVC